MYYNTRKGLTKSPVYGIIPNNLTKTGETSDHGQKFYRKDKKVPNGT
ncbi:hypothetical protein AGMMS50230_10580 [Spirochaetia bacterium]|nr:hypothetical protein AGMMS50230_10580 [Spirochaetia bacterium]